MYTTAKFVQDISEVKFEKIIQTPNACKVLVGGDSEVKQVAPRFF